MGCQEIVVITCIIGVGRNRLSGRPQKRSLHEIFSLCLRMPDYGNNPNAWSSAGQSWKPWAGYGGEGSYRAPLLIILLFCTCSGGG
jgi:hypothetical protein